MQDFVGLTAFASEKGFGGGRHDPMMISQFLGHARRERRRHLEINGHQL
jgi:hypothetical protein